MSPKKLTLLLNAIKPLFERHSLYSVNLNFGGN